MWRVWEEEAINPFSYISFEKSIESDWWVTEWDTSHCVAQVSEHEDIYTHTHTVNWHLHMA